MARQFDSFSSVEVCDYLRSHVPSLDNSVFERITEHKIDGEVFLSLNEEYLREIAPLLGDRLKIKRLLNSLLDSNPLDCTTSTPPSSVIPSPGVSTLSSSSRRSNTVSLSLSDVTGDSPLIQENGSEEMDVAEEVSIDVSSGSSSHVESSTDYCDATTPSGVSIKADPIAINFDKSYAKNLVIPTRFSAGTTSAIKTGVLKKKHRDEIVSSLSTLILVHTSRPTSDDYSIICRRLIEKYPNLKDKVDDGYSSWRKKLRQRFVNLRRPSRAAKAGVAVPPRSNDSDGNNCVTTGSDAAYEQNIKFLQKSYHSKKWSVSGMIMLLAETSKQRRHWISTECPPVKVVLEKFPCLADPQVMIKEFCRIADVDEEGIQTRWTDIGSKLLKYAPLEDKKSVKSLLERYNLIKSKNDDRETAYAIQILSAILNRTKNNSKGRLLTVFEGESIDIDTAIKSIIMKSPCIIGFGATLDSVSEIKVVIEEENVLRMPSMLSALNYCVSSYYVFNISYPSEFRTLMIFLEKYVYGIKPSFTLPLSATVLYDNLLKT